MLNSGLVESDRKSLRQVGQEHANFVERQLTLDFALSPSVFYHC